MPMNLTVPIKTYLESERKPAFELPPLSCDAHVHVFGPASLFPFDESRNFTPADAPKEKLFALHKRLGITRCVIVGSALHGYDLRATQDAIAHGNGHYLGIALVEPAVTLRELERLKSVGFRGVRFNFMQHLKSSLTASDLLQFSKRLADTDMHLQVHFEKELIHELAPILESCAQHVPVVVDHVGRVNAGDGLTGKHYMALCRLLEKTNFHVKVSGIDRIDQTPPYLAGKKLAADLVARYPTQCLWGLDWPHPNHTHIPDDVTLVEALGEIAPSPEALTALLVHNPQKLYKFEN
jgi:2-pyrone-4,6-dicarboxylate lactonase